MNHAALPINAGRIAVKSPNATFLLLRYSMESLMMTQLKRSISAVFLAATLAAILGCATTTSTESTGEYIDDAVITTKVKAAILDQPQLKSSEIRVETFKGTVQLRGSVESQFRIDKAGEVARGVEGVRSVKNELQLK